MSLISVGIDRVRVIGLPAGVWSDGAELVSGKMAVIKWRSSWSDKFYQVYINGQLAGVTIDTDQRMMLVRLPISLEVAVRLEVFAIEAGECYQDFSEELEKGFGDSGRVKINLLADQSLPRDSRVEVFWNCGNGEIDYSECINRFAVNVWTSWQDKAGFGTARFGEGDFGYDSAGAVGFGRGCFGQGQFGLGAETIEWVSDVLESGTYKFGVKVVDSRGQVGSASESGDMVVVRGAEPAESVAVLSFEKEENKLVLGIS